MRPIGERSPTTGPDQRTATTRVDGRPMFHRRDMRAMFAGTTLAFCLVTAAHHARAESDDADGKADHGQVVFAVLASDTTADPDRTALAVRAIDDSDARFVVHFERGGAAPTVCDDGVLERRRTLLDASAKPAVPVVGATEWAECPASAGDPFERLQRVADAFYGNDESLGRNRMPWARESALPRFRRYRENLRWQAGRVLFATINLPANNNDYRMGAGRNGEFEERVVANRAWLERTFRIATERRLPTVVLFVDAAPRFGMPLRAPDSRTRERDGYYEWKLAMRELVSTFKGRVLLVQGRDARDLEPPSALDHPLRDAAGRPIENLYRIAAPPFAIDGAWMRVDIEPTRTTPFRVSMERVFDDPTGELYGPGRAK